MGGLSRVIEYLIAGRLLSSSLPAPSKEDSLLQSLVFIAAVFLFSSLAIGVLYVYVWTKQRYTIETAIGISALVCFGINLVLVAITFAFTRWRNQKLVGMGEKVSTILQEVAASLETDMGSPIRDNPKTSALLAATAGLMAGKHA